MSLLKIKDSQKKQSAKKQIKNLNKRLELVVR